jgi:hypothetical protein
MNQPVSLRDASVQDIQLDLLRAVGKSPAELLTGEPHPHWLKALGYTLLSRNEA